MPLSAFLEKVNKLLDIPLSEIKSQEDIQFLIKALPKYQKSNSLQLISSMRITLCKNYCDCYLKHLSITELWLLFFVFEKYGKKWNEARKDWL